MSSDSPRDAQYYAHAQKQEVAEVLQFCIFSEMTVLNCFSDTLFSSDVVQFVRLIPWRNSRNCFVFLHVSGIDNRIGTFKECS
jgi:hypothetical protein